MVELKKGEGIEAEDAFERLAEYFAPDNLKAEYSRIFTAFGDVAEKSLKSQNLPHENREKLIFARSVIAQHGQILEAIGPLSKNVQGDIAYRVAGLALALYEIALYGTATKPQEIYWSKVLPIRRAEELRKAKSKKNAPREEALASAIALALNGRTITKPKKQAEEILQAVNSKLESGGHKIVSVDTIYRRLKSSH